LRLLQAHKVAGELPTSATLGITARLLAEGLPITLGVAR
jgi:hypothetical protein